MNDMKIYYIHAMMIIISFFFLTISQRPTNSIPRSFVMDEDMLVSASRSVAKAFCLLFKATVFAIAPCDKCIGEGKTPVSKLSLQFWLIIQDRRSAPDMQCIATFCINCISGLEMTPL